jgi:hypothetical protein
VYEFGDIATLTAGMRNWLYDDRDDVVIHGTTGFTTVY